MHLTDDDFHLFETVPDVSITVVDALVDISLMLSLMEAMVS